MTDDKRLIEDYLPIEAISAEGAREKSARKGHISTLHLWWARRPLVACRAAVYGALVPASRFVPNGGADEKKKSLGRANSARFATELCQFPGGPRAIEEAQRHILVAHADRLTQELADWKTGNASKPGWVEEFKFSANKVTVEDISAGRAPRPRVLDMFAGGGAIPLEALRLGCEAYALDLNPVAHIIELCTLVYPQKYGKHDSTARGMTGSKNVEGALTWGGLAEEVRFWGRCALKKVQAEIGDLYPSILDPSFKGKRHSSQANWLQGVDEKLPVGALMPVAYIWTRTVKCKNPRCNATVPLLRQTWLRKKESGYVALKPIVRKGATKVEYQVVKATSAKALGFDPEAGSKAGNATCLFCGTVADSDHVKAEGCAGHLREQLIAVVATRPGTKGKEYLSANDLSGHVPDSDGDVGNRLAVVLKRVGLDVPPEKIVTDAKNSCWTYLYGLDRFGQLFTKRQLLVLFTFIARLREVEAEMRQLGYSGDHVRAIVTSLALVLDKMADYSSTLSRWGNDDEGIANAFCRQALPMVWDFAEASPFSGITGSFPWGLEYVALYYNHAETIGLSANVARGSAATLPYESDIFDAVITDPPYYDNVPYSNISDFFYVWLKRSVGHLYAEHFAADITPKKAEAVADATRHGGSKDKAKVAYENMMARSFAEAHRTLKKGGELVVVYAHKTTLGWATLVDALRAAGFTVQEAWPLDTESRGRMRAHSSAALASSIFLIARKREGVNTGSFEEAIKPELEKIVRERVETLWAMGISGADLVIACVGAGLRAFTKYARVEYANGEEVPAERFLAEVETAVLETILGKLSKTLGPKNGQTTLTGLDPATRFYILWRYTYGAAELDAGEAIIFANGTHVELDGQHSLTQGKCALLKKKASKYLLHDFTVRGDEHTLGQPSEDGNSAPVVDALHRLLWLMEHKPLKIPEFLSEAKPSVEQLRLVAQALAGPALSGGELSDVSSTAEQSALGKLLANWSTVMVGKAAVEERRTGQQTLFKN